jgi:hypothetical protein
LEPSEVGNVKQSEGNRCQHYPSRSLSFHFSSNSLLRRPESQKHVPMDSTNSCLGSAWPAGLWTWF